jgi:hypothetical protein
LRFDLSQRAFQFATVARDSELIWIMSPLGGIGLSVDVMSQNAPVPLRHCPLCGIAMQARKSAEHLPKFDRFECLSCDTVIEMPHRNADKDRAP